MTLADLFAGAAFLVSLFTLLGGAFWMGQLSIKVDTMWDFQIRRGMSEAAKEGIAKINSPIKFTAEAMGRLEPIKIPLQQLAVKYPTVKDSDLMLKIEQNFGEQLLKLVCVPYKVTQGACLLLALAVARNTDTLDLIKEIK